MLQIWQQYFKNLIHLPSRYVLPLRISVYLISLTSSSLFEVLLVLPLVGWFILLQSQGAQLSSVSICLVWVLLVIPLFQPFLWFHLAVLLLLFPVPTAWKWLTGLCSLFWRESSHSGEVWGVIICILLALPQSCILFPLRIRIRKLFPGVTGWLRVLPKFKSDSLVQDVLLSWMCAFLPWSYQLLMPVGLQWPGHTDYCLYNLLWVFLQKLNLSCSLCTIVNAFFVIEVIPAWVFCVHYDCFLLCSAVS